MINEASLADGKPLIEAGWPGISVVVPCEGRLPQVRELVASLAAAMAAYPGPAEAILVDSSAPAEAAEIERLCAAHGAAFRRGGRSVREKRNLGIREALHEVILFVDSDCRAEADLLIEHGRVCREWPAAAGCAGLVQFDRDDSFYWQSLERTSYLGFFSRIAHCETTLWAPTANVSYRAGLVRQAGGFDETMPFRLGGDDVALGLQVARLGGRLRCNPRAVVHHARETWSKQAVAERAFRWGRAHYHLFRRFPERRTLAVPNVPMAWGLLAAGSLAAWLATRQPGYLLLPWLWLVACLALEALFLALYRRSLRSSARDWLGAQLSLLFNAGALYEGLAHLDPRMLFQSLSYSDPQPGQADDFILQQRKTLRTWAILLSLGLTALLAPAAILWARP
jgi:hypothetical protein